MTMEQRARIDTGRALVKAYCDRLKLDAVERRQDYTISDAIADLLHYAHSRKFDTAHVLYRAHDHFKFEVSK